MRTFAFRCAAVALPSALLLSAGCASVGERQRTDAAAVAKEAAGRIGAEPAAEAAALGLLAKPLSEDAAVRVALLRSPRVRAAYADLGIRSAEEAEAGVPANPVLSANAALFSYGTEWELQLAQPLLDAFFIPARRRLAGAELEAAKARITRTLVELAFEVRRGVVAARAAKAQTQAAQGALVVAEETAKLARKLHAAGNLPDKRLTAAEMDEAQARQDLAEAQTAQESARERLNAAMGLFGADTRWTLADAPPEPPPKLERKAWEGAEAKAVAASLELAESRAETQAEVERAGIADWKALAPNASAGLGARKDPDSSQWGLGPSVSVPIPLWNWGQARRAAGEARVRAELARQEETAIRVRAAARAARDRLWRLAAREEHLRQAVLPLASRLVAETLRDYDAMQVGAFDVLAAKGREWRAKAQHARVEGEWRLAREDARELFAGGHVPVAAAAQDAAHDHPMNEEGASDAH